ncbi:metal transporter [Paracoccus zhejiangensis]|uniref:Metal transporter n=1 Tax=Paracoccus zhejiangensis TaxID=1077935 RepID=A0A2H5F232_9RHOB|nr:metal transporter [Paracoccus zhejiangensis]
MPGRLGQSWGREKGARVLIQIALGAVLLMLSTVIAGATALAMLGFFRRRSDWLAREPHDPKLVAALMLASLWVLLIVTLGVWGWALTFHLLGIFASLEEALYFSLVVFTTLGFGDVLLPQQWRLLGGLMAVNGLLNMGMLTAVMIETLRSIRARQKGDWE